jgi:hypothetical protein
VHLIAQYLPSLPAPSLASGSPTEIMQVVWDAVAMASVHATAAGREHTCGCVLLRGLRTMCAGGVRTGQVRVLA